MQGLRGMVAVLAAVFGSVAVAGPGAWNTNGPEGGAIERVVVDPLASGVVLASTHAGVFRSSDGGLGWARFADGLGYSFPGQLEVASSASVVYLVADGVRLLRSVDGDPWMPTALTLGPDDYITDVSLLAGDGQQLVVASNLGLHLSSDGGATFGLAAAAGLPAGLVARVDYASATRIYVMLRELPSGVTAPVWRSDDGGATFAPTADLPFPYHYVAYLEGELEAAPGDPYRIYAANGYGLFTSGDGGASWTECGGGLRQIGQVTVEPADAARIWVAAPRGVHRSTDACASFTTLDTGLSADGMRPDLSTSVALAPGYPADPHLYVGTAFGGVYRSTDAGASFTPSNTGLVSTQIRAIATHPLSADRILLGYGDAFTASPTLYRSDDGGASWLRSNSGLRATQIRAIAIDPTTASAGGGAHVYAVGTGRPNDVAPSPATADGGVYKSIDGGISWTTIDGGLPADASGAAFIGNVRSVVLDPRSCTSPPASGLCSAGTLQTVYLTASGRVDGATGNYVAARIYKSNNAGSSWSPSETGLPPATPFSDACPYSQIAVPLVIDPSDSNTLYVGLGLSDPYPDCGAPSVANGVFKSTDGGASWVHSSNGLPRMDGPGSSHWNVLALAIDPSDSDVLYAAAYRSEDGSFVGRVYKSVDGGANWFDSSVGIAGQDVRALLVDPDDPLVVYAASGGSLGNPGGIYRSTDGGLTWNSLNIGLPVESSTALALDPHRPGRLLAGTRGGLWELTLVEDEDSDGAATEVENSAPNGGDGNANGVPDAQEPHVASIHGVHGGLIWSRAPLAPPPVTIEVQPLAGNCARINSAHALPGTSLPADVARGVAPTTFERGVLRFELPDCQRARVTVTFHDVQFDGPDYSWRNYGPLQPGDASSLQWYGFEQALHLGNGRWQLTLDASARGNWRDSANNILFVGGPGFLDLQVFASGFE